MKRRSSQERDEADARAQADARREALLAQLRDREASDRDGPVPPVPDAAPPDAEPAPAAEADAELAAELADESDPGDSAEELTG
ncbi:MAG: hypothetical protein ABIQ05_01305 [Candidatus Limnocylindria bacterium]